MGTKRASWLGVLCWSLNFGPQRESWEIQWRLFRNGDKATALQSKLDILCRLGGVFGVPPKHGNHGALPRSGKSPDIILFAALLFAIYGFLGQAHRAKVRLESKLKAVIKILYVPKSIDKSLF